MKSKKPIQILGLAGTMAVSVGAFAYGNDDYRGGPAFHSHPVFKESLRLTNEVNERQDKQLDRILKGFYDKRITPPEFRRLMDEQQAIQRMERQFLADGVLTRFEYQKLDAALNASNRNIFREGHDAQGRPSIGSGYGNWNR